MYLANNNNKFYVTCKSSVLPGIIKALIWIPPTYTNGEI